MQTEPVYSIVIPTFNHAQFLPKCLHSIMSQTFDSWEAIVVNNYSQDETIDIVNGLNDPRIKLINFHNQGVIGASRNLGIQKARGEFVAFLDSDDWWYPEKLKTISEFLNGFDLMFHDLDIYTEKGRKWLRKSRGFFFRGPVFPNLMLRGNPISNSSAVVRKKIILDAGGLSEEPSLIGVEDYDLWLRISRLSERFLYIPKSLGGYRIGPGSVSSGSVQKEVARWEALYALHLPYLSGGERRESENYLSYYLGKMKKNLGMKNESRKLFLTATHSSNYRLRTKAIVQLILTLLHI